MTSNNEPVQFGFIDMMFMQLKRSDEKREVIEVSAPLTHCPTVQRS